MPTACKKIDAMKVPIDFPDELYEWLRETAFRRRTSMAHIVREALRDYRDRLSDEQTEHRGGRSQ